MAESVLLYGNDMRGSTRGRNASSESSQWIHTTRPHKIEVMGKVLEVESVLQKVANYGEN
jgi:hypothetical protein